MQKNWNILSPDNRVVTVLAKALSVSEIVAHLLVLRGITTFEGAKLFFRPEISHLHDPFLMKDMQKAVDRIELAIVKKEKNRERSTTSEVVRLVCDNKQIRKHTNWKPKISIEKGLDRTINWFKENKEHFKHDIYHV